MVNKDMEWVQHIKDVDKKKLAPSATLQWVLDHFERTKETPGQAIDLGCGSGVDTIALLKGGWSVLALDAEKSAIENLLQLHETFPYKRKLDTSITHFENMELPACGLINASFALPFCHPDHFNNAWQKVVRALVPGGWFCGHLFGPSDSWFPNEKMTFHSANAIEQLFVDFEFRRYKEVNERGKTVGGTPKNWHVFHIVAQKR